MGAGLMSLSRFLIKKKSNKMTNYKNFFPCVALAPKFFSSKAFVFSLEALIAIILTIGFLTFYSLSLQNPSVPYEINLRNNLGDAVLYLQNSGLGVQTLDNNSLQQSQRMSLLYNEISSMFPKNAKLRLEVTEYDSNATQCRSAQDFDSCFPEKIDFDSIGDSLPTSEAITHKRIIITSNAAPVDCDISNDASFSPQETLYKKLFFSGAREEPRLFFASVPDLNMDINFGVNIIPSPAQCDSPIRVDMNVVINDSNALYGRSPADIMLVLDRSGSMSWDGLLDLTSPQEVFVDGNYAFVADGSSGLRVIDVNSPATPNLKGTYNSPGTATGVFVSGNTAYLADGSGGLRTVNVTNKTAPSLIGSLSTIGTATKVTSNGNYAYVVTTSNSSTSVYDLNIGTVSSVDYNFGKSGSESTLAQSFTPTGIGINGASVYIKRNSISAPSIIITDTASRDRNIGKSTAESTVGQSFVATTNYITGARVYVKKVGSFSNRDLYVYLRSSIAGANLASATISSGSVGASYAWIDANWSAYGVTPGQTYYIVLEKQGSADSGKYYSWRANITNPYASGTAYQQSTPMDNNDMQLMVYTSPGSSGNVTLRLRSSISGADLATGTINQNSITSSYSWQSVSFATTYVDPTQVYYLVIDTTSTTDYNFYSIRGDSTNSYSNGTAYQETTQISGSDLWVRIQRLFSVAGLQIIDVSNPANPLHKANIRGTDPMDVNVSGNYAYFADGSAGLKIINISNPLLPTLSGSIDTYNASSVSVNGNYAYVADDTNGLQIINVTNPSAPAFAGWYNTPGTASDVFYYSDGNVYVADNNSLLVINISNPASPQLARTYAAPYSYTGEFISTGWAFVIPGYSTGLTTFSLQNGPKIDQLHTSANSFVDNNGWKAAYDQIGLVSFGGSATLDQNLLHVTDANKTILHSRINSLVANNGTPMGDAINSARTELTSSRATSGSYRFEVLLTDGQSNSGADPITAANTARDNNIKIYTIGFGGDADAATLQQIASITDANYYFASDLSALSDVFNLIAIEIGESLTTVKRLDANDSNIVIPLPAFMSCANIIDSNGGVCDSNILRYYAGRVGYRANWSNYFIFKIDCNNDIACSTSSLTLPFSGSYFIFRDVNGVIRQIPWDLNQIINFNYADLGLAISGVRVTGTNELSVDINVYNSGLVATAQTGLEFSNSPTDFSSPLEYISITPLSAGQYRLFLSNPLSTSSRVYAYLNRAGSVRECPQHNKASFYCAGSSGPKFFVVDVYAWT
jgi:uncharacterized protein YegL